MDEVSQSCNNPNNSNFEGNIINVMTPFYVAINENIKEI